MNQTTWRLYSLIAMAMVCIQGCEAPLPTQPPTESAIDLSALWAEWQVIANQDPVERDVERAMTLTAAMAQTPSGLIPMLRVMDDETASADVKVLIVMGLTPVREYLNPYENELIGLTSTENSSGVRTFGTHLLGLIDGPAGLARMSLLLDDDSRAVREAAMGVWVAANGEAVAERLDAFWKDPETTVAIREQIVLGMSPELVARFVPLYAEALSDQRLNAAARYKAATVLGQAGGPEHITALQQSVENDPDPYVRERAEGGLALLKASVGSSIPAASAETDH